jgi:hypothetical protein
MGRLLLCGLAAALGAGCLSTPPPAEGDAATAPRCRREPLPTGSPWPSGATVREARIADVDGDGRDDLVVWSAPDVASAAGPSQVLVAYGPVDRAAPQYHVVLDVAAAAQIQAWGVTLDDLDGDGCLDLTVAGPPTNAGGNAYAAIWLHGGGAVPWTGAPARARLGQVPTGGASPLLPVWVDLSANPARDLVVTQLQHVDLFVGVDRSPDALTSGVVVAPTSACNDWDNINGVAAQPATGGDGGARLNVFGHYKHSTIAMSGGSATAATAICHPGDGRIFRSYAIGDLDGVAPLDLVFGGNDTVNARLLAGTDAVITPTTPAMLCPGFPLADASGQSIQGLALGELDGTARPELLVIDHDAGAAASTACLLDLDEISAARLGTNGTSPFDLGPIVARTAVIGALDGAPGAWILSAEGQATCLRQAVGGTSLTRCQ